MARVFLSYKREERDRVLAIVSALEAKGHKVWWDAHLDPRDASYNRQITREIEGAKACIVAWSKLSVESDFVASEAQMARAQKKLVCVKLDHDCEPPVPFNVLETIDLSDWRGDAGHPEWKRVLGAISRPGDAARRALAGGPAMPEKPKRSAREIAGMALRALPKLAVWGVGLAALGFVGLIAWGFAEVAFEDAARARTQHQIETSVGPVAFGRNAASDYRGRSAANVGDGDISSALGAQRLVTWCQDGEAARAWSRLPEPSGAGARTGNRLPLGGEAGDRCIAGQAHFLTGWVVRTVGGRGRDDLFSEAPDSESVNDLAQLDLVGRPFASDHHKERPCDLPYPSNLPRLPIPGAYSEEDHARLTEEYNERMQNPATRRRVEEYHERLDQCAPVWVPNDPALELRRGERLIISDGNDLIGDRPMYMYAVPEDYRFPNYYLEPTFHTTRDGIAEYSCEVGLSERSYSSTFELYGFSGGEVSGSRRERLWVDFDRQVWATTTEGGELPADVDGNGRIWESIEAGSDMFICMDLRRSAHAIAEDSRGVINGSISSWRCRSSLDLDTMERAFLSHGVLKAPDLANSHHNALYQRWLQNNEYDGVRELIPGTATVGLGSCREVSRR